MERITDIKQIMSLIGDIESNELSSPSVDHLSLNPIMKSSATLALYNLIESTTTKCLKLIHDRIIAERVRFTHLNPNLQKLFITCYENQRRKEGANKSNADITITIYSLMSGTSNVCLEYKEIADHAKLYSGNLEAEVIEKVLKKYGLNFQEKEPALVKIKEARNTLAHGNKGFQEFGRDLPRKTAEDNLIKVEAYINSLLDAISDYIDNKLYLSPTD